MIYDGYCRLAQPVCLHGKLCAVPALGLVSEDQLMCLKHCHDLYNIHGIYMLYFRERHGIQKPVILSEVV